MGASRGGRTHIGRGGRVTAAPGPPPRARPLDSRGRPRGSVCGAVGPGGTPGRDPASPGRSADDRVLRTCAPARNALHTGSHRSGSYRPSSACRPRQSGAPFAQGPPDCGHPPPGAARPARARPAPCCDPRPPPGCDACVSDGEDDRGARRQPAQEVTRPGTMGACRASESRVASARSGSPSRCSTSGGACRPSSASGSWSRHARTARASPSRRWTPRRSAAAARRRARRERSGPARPGAPSDSPRRGLPARGGP